LRQILSHVERKDEEAKNKGRRSRPRDKSTVQFFLWDSAQRKHLTRLMGRHLDAILRDEDLEDLAWLFPPSEDVVRDWRDATRSSPITVMSDVVENHLAVPVPHEYTLMEVVDCYNAVEERQYVPHVSDYYSDPLSSLIPSERGHKMWSHNPPDGDFPGWTEVMSTIKEVVKKKVRGLETVTQRLRDDLKDSLSYKAAPKIRIGPPRRLPAASWDAQLWYAFSRLNASLDKLEVQRIRALPAHEREARFKSARLRRRFQGDEKREALASINAHQEKSLDIHDDDLWVFEMRENSRDVSIREGDFLRALSSEHDPGNSELLEKSVGKALDAADARPRIRRKCDSVFSYRGLGTPMTEAMRVTVKAIDREAKVMVLRPKYPDIVRGFEREGVTDLSSHAILDPIEKDFFNSKLKKALKEIGNPDIAAESPAVQRAVGQEGVQPRKMSPHSPAAEVLWSPQSFYEKEFPIDTESLRSVLKDKGLVEGGLNRYQWNAFSSALQRGLSLIWGPPGTGKSRTLRTITKGAVSDAYHRGEVLRLLITAPTYRALDEVLLGTFNDLSASSINPDGEEGELQIRRLRSKYRTKKEEVPKPLDLKLNKYNPSRAVGDFRNRLTTPRGITVVGATPSQVFNLVI
jgi:hypothetical protein